MQQLHILLTALRSPLVQQMLLRALAEGRGPNDVFVRLDPAFTRTIKIASAMDLVDIQSNGSVRLADQGKAVASFIGSQTAVFAKEKDFLDQLPARITQKQFQPLLEVR